MLSLNAFSRKIGAFGHGVPENVGNKNHAQSSISNNHALFIMSIAEKKNEKDRGTRYGLSSIIW